MANPHDTSLTPAEKRCIDARQKAFREQFEHQNKATYISVEFELTGDQREVSSTLEGKPFEPRKMCPDDLIDWHPRLPYLIVLSGEYGVGKTRFIYELAQKGLTLAAGRKRMGSEEPPQPESKTAGDDTAPPLPIFPVTLARLRRASEKIDFQQLSWKDFDGDDKGTGDGLARMVQNGKVLLALDGLDELVHNPTEFQSFFKGLATLLRENCNGAPQYRVLLTVRSEFLRAWHGISEISDLRGWVQAELIPNLYFLKLAGFDEDGLQKYLMERPASRWPQGLPPPKNQAPQSHLAIAKAVCLLNDKHFPLLPVYRLLKRPLLARLFADWIDLRLAAPDFQLRELEDLMAVNGRVALLERFVDAATHDWVVLGGDNPPMKDGTTVALWDQTELAKLALDLYRNHGGWVSEFPKKDVANCVEPAALKCVVPPLGGMLTKDWVIHKCPFIIRRAEPSNSESKEPADPEDNAKEDTAKYQFSHRLFLEYFTARGVWDEPERDAQVRQQHDRNQTQPADARPSAPNQFNAFDNLVLNVDMRKFLREIADTQWLDRTRHAYVLAEGQEKEWTDAGFDAPAGEERVQLDKNRCYLLAVMTYPDDETELKEEVQRVDKAFGVPEPADQMAVDRIANEIQRFLDDYQSKWKHPRYLIPCFEPIAVFLHTYPRLAAQRGLDSTFARVLQHHYGAARSYAIDPLKDIQANDADQFKSGFKLSTVLLVERCLSIALRLRLKWGPGQAEEVLKQLNSFKNRVPTRDDNEGLLALERIRQLCEVIGNVKAAGGWPSR